MIGTGLSKAHEKLYEAQLATSHDMRVALTVLDRNEAVIKHLPDPVIVSGSVDMDEGQDISRTASIVLLDPKHKLHFDGGNPADGALYADNFIHVEYGVYVEALSRWVDVPVFTGPLTLFERIGPEVTLEAQGKESLGLDPHLVTAGYTLPRGMSLEHAIESVLRRLGEEKFALGMVKGKLHKHRAVHTGLSPWSVIIGGGNDQNGNPIPGLMDRAVGHQRLFYDGNGRLTAKNKGGADLFVFTGDHITTVPDYKYDVSTFRNHVIVTGGTPKKSKKHYHGEAALPSSHPLSPQSLARNGKPRQLATFFSGPSLKSDAACHKKAEQILHAAAQAGVDVTFDTLPVPHLEEGDFVRLDWNGYAFSFPVKSWSLPLTSDQAMTLGSHRRIRFAHRRHHTHHHRGNK